MQTGQQVGFITADGKRHQSTIIAVVGAGASHWKTLDLSYRVDGEVREVVKVPHENDAEAGAAFWLEQGVHRKPVPEHVADAVAAAEARPRKK